MKKILLTIVFLILILPMTVFAQAEGISIKSVTLEGKSETTTQLAEPTYNGLELSFSVKFQNLNDFAKYKVIIENTSDTEYEIETVNQFETSSFMTYQYSFEDSNKVVKAKSDKVMYVDIRYSTEVSSDAFTGNKYQEDNVLSINVDTEPTTDPEPEKEKPKEEDEVENPNTGANLPWVIFISILIIGMGIYLATKKKLPLKKISAFIIAIGISIPLIASAVEKLYVKVNTHVEIERENPKFTVSCTDATYTFESHMTWADFISSRYNTEHWSLDEHPYATDEGDYNPVIHIYSDYYIVIDGGGERITEKTYSCRYLPFASSEGGTASDEGGE